MRDGRRSKWTWGTGGCPFWRPGRWEGAQGYGGTRDLFSQGRNRLRGQATALRAPPPESCLGRVDSTDATGHIGLTGKVNGEVHELSAAAES